MKSKRQRMRIPVFSRRGMNAVGAVVIPVILAIVFLAGCYRGRPSGKPPIHLNPNMDTQPKYKPLGESSFFADGSAMRVPVPGTVARGELHENTVYYTGRDEKGNLVKKSPVPVTMGLLKRGRERYTIYCTPCHSALGDGKGIITKYNYVPPGNFHEQRLVDIEDGHIFDVITNGIRNMPSHRHQIPVADRWAIVSYVRALQFSQNAPLEDVPDSVRETLQQQSQRDGRE